MIKLSKAEFVKLLQDVKGATFATITADVDARCTGGKNGPFAGTRKVSVVNVALNVNYEKSVNRQLEREGKTAEFEASANPWGSHVENCPLIVNGEKFYLQGIPQKTLKTAFFKNGTEVEKQEIEAYLPKKSENQTQGTDKEIVVRRWSLENIKEIKIGGNEYYVEN